MKNLAIVEHQDIKRERKKLNLEYNFMCQERKIVLLSNTQDLRRIIQISLETISDWQVFVADLNYESLIMVEVIKPDIILLDTVLPDLRSLAKIKTILAYPGIQNIPIMLLTERMRLADRQLYQNLGSVGAIAKPFDTIDLANQIATKLNWELN